MTTLVKINISQRLSLFITLIVFFGCYLSLFLALPSIGTEINNLLQNLPSIVSYFQQTLIEMNNYFSKEDIDLIFANLSNQINSLLSSALGQLAGTISLMFNAILYAIMIPLMVFFFLKDKKELLPIASFVLPKENGFMQSVFSEMNDQLFNYVTGKFLEMIIVASASYALFALLGLPYAVFSRRNTYKLIRFYCRSIFFVLRSVAQLRVEIRGEIPQEPCLICSKHQSFLDVMMLASVVPNFRFIIKHQLTYLPVIGFYARQTGCIPVNRNKKIGTVNKMMEALNQEEK